MTDQQTRDQEQQQEQQDTQRSQQMCCEGGMTAADHRAKSPDGKCCTD